MSDIIRVWFSNKEKIAETLKSQKTICESLIDPPKTERPLDIWEKYDGKYKIKDDIKKQILEIYDRIFEAIGIKKSDVVKIQLTGSIVGYNWTKFSDVDSAVVLKMSQEEIDEKLTALFKKFKSIYFPLDKVSRILNVYLVPVDDKFKHEFSLDGIYQIYPTEKFLFDKTVNITIDYTAYEIAFGWARKIDLDIGELKRDFFDYIFYYDEYYVRGDNIAVEKEKIDSMLKMKWKEIIYDIISIENTIQSIKKMRTENHKMLYEEHKKGNTDFDKLRVTYKNIYMFDGIIIKKLIERYGYMETIEKVLYLWKKFSDEEISKDEFMKTMRTVFPKNGFFVVGE